jgi:transposase InsO family protein
MAFIHSQREQYPLQVLCRVLQVSRSGYYAWRRRGLSQRAQANARLLVAIKQAHKDSRETYGSPRVHQVLLRQGQRCGRHRVARLMRLAELRGVPRRKFVRTTQRAAEEARVPDRLQRDFSASAPNQKWVSDITYIATQEGWLYLATVLDLYSRRIVGWAMAAHMRAELVRDALQMAYVQRGAPKELIYHSDRGGQYSSALVQDWLTEHGLLASMGSTGDCYDNAVAESFFSTLKRECVAGECFPTRRAARSAIFDFMETFYNRQRLHSTLGYQSPLDFENQSGTPLT